MKYIVLFIFLFSTLSFAGTECSKAIDHAKLSCESSVNQCNDVHECLVRKDTCVDKEPKNEIECNTLHECGQEFKVKFYNKFKTNGTKCEYRWHQPSSGNGLCLVKGHFLFSEEACPGRISGLLGAFAYGLNSAIDKFDCRGVNKKYKQKTESCIKSMKKVATVCPNTPDYLNKYKILKCTYSSKFTSFQSGQFSLDQATGNRVNQGPRNAPNNRQPHGDDGDGGSTGSALGSGQ
ncbi:MAG: hypothetical protein HN576_17555 [Bacteriovoracaceae bacterium]|jgi:hypothetical protein|nr:hypothetical protein [Bacteriovoracaceae bacterium]